MTQNWDETIRAISIVKPEVVNRDKIKAMLSMDWTYDEQVLDNLLMLEAIDAETYEHFLKRLIENTKSRMGLLQERLARCKDEGFIPIVYWGFGRASLGAGIDLAVKE